MVDEEKIALLVDAGMKRVRMGIQTGSIETLHKVYKRPGSQEQLARAVSILSKFTDKIDPPSYDFIVDNPWENDEERYKTLEFLVNIPRPFTLLTFSLTYYPGWVLSFLIRPFMYKLNWTWIPFIIFWACKVVNLKRVEIWSALRGNWLPLRRVYKAYFVKNGKSY